jgi:glycosyltransferase involved in cell wall biosynthesis
MPVYNGSAHIAKSIESVLAQTYKDFYFNIFDNCSTDNTSEIVGKFRDPRINYFRNEKNLGLVGNHQRCIDFCTTEYVNIWHDDDIMLPENLERKIDLLENNNNVGLVFSNVDLIDEKNNLLHYKWNEECRRNYVESGKSLFRKYMKRMHIGALFFIGSVITRKELLVQAGGFRPNDSPLTCDSAMWLRALLFTDCACIGDPLVKYRNYTGNTCSNYYGLKYLKEHFKVVERTLNEHQIMIQDVSSLKNEIERNFLKEAMLRGVDACGKDDFETANNYMRWARTISNNRLTNQIYWGLWLRLILGPKAAKIYRPLKRKL